MYKQFLIETLFYAKLKQVLLFLFFIQTIILKSQDTLCIMHYNLMYYDQATTFCPSVSNQTKNKNAFLRTIINHVKPDVLSVNEVSADSLSHQQILDSCMNYSNNAKYKRCYFSNLSNSDLTNELYYNTSKLTLFSQTNIPTLVRDINMYTFYPLRSQKQVSTDTSFITFIVIHLKAGNSNSDITLRAEQTGILMNYLDSVKAKGNYVLMGDLNVYSSNEPCYQQLINYSPGKLIFNDPIQKQGEWNNNSDFSLYHTQSTHNTQSSCFSSGGLDDRFDQVLLSDYILNGIENYSYIPESYNTIGQDGLHFDMPVNFDINASAPENVIDALYGMSDHLPVSLKIAFNKNHQISPPITQKINMYFSNPVKDFINLTICSPSQDILTIEIFNIIGQQHIIKEMEVPKGTVKIELSTGLLKKGIYLIKITDSRQNSIVKKFIKG